MLYAVQALNHWHHPFRRQEDLKARDEIKIMRNRSPKISHESILTALSLRSTTRQSLLRPGWDWRLMQRLEWQPRLEMLVDRSPHYFPLLQLHLRLLGGKLKRINQKGSDQFEKPPFLRLRVIVSLGSLSSLKSTRINVAQVGKSFRQMAHSAYLKIAAFQYSSFFSISVI